MPQGKEKQFWIRVSKGLLKHCERMKEAIWLFLWYIDRTTREEGRGRDRVGFVLGGAPIKDRATAYDLGCSIATVSRWRKKLEVEGYIQTRKTPMGHVVYILKSKKWSSGLSVESEQVTCKSANAICKNANAICKNANAICKNANANKIRQGYDSDKTVDQEQEILNDDGYSPLDGQNWKTFGDHLRFPAELERLLAAKGARAAA